VTATIIDCNGTPSENHRGFYFHNNESLNSVLNGITVTGGYMAYGGAILCQHSSPTIRNCVLVNNSSGSGISSAGAAMQNEDNSNPILVGCTITANSADNLGGGVRNHTSSPLLFNCLLAGNSAKYGGAVHNENSSSNPTVINCTLAGNTAGTSGGGIINAGGTAGAAPVLTNCILWANSDEGGVDESAQIHGGTPVVNYTCLQGWTGSFGGIGNTGADPCFADADSPDYHLKSEAGRFYTSIYTELDPTGDDFINLLDYAALANPWQQQGSSIPADLDRSGVVDLADLALLLDNYLDSYVPQEWVLDTVTSPCIDAGDPSSDWSEELSPNGSRINMGAYGGTSQASKSP
jgi:hypothetical protein